MNEKYRWIDFENIPTHEYVSHPTLVKIPNVISDLTVATYTL